MSQTSGGDSDSSGGTDSGVSASGGGTGGGGGSPTTSTTAGSATTGGVTSEGVITDVGGDGTSTGDSVDTGPIPICAGVNPNYTCVDANSCVETDCGSILSPWDADGCLCPSCVDDGDCTGGLACFRPGDWGGCLSSVPIQCSDASGTCTCRGADLPDCGGGICVPESAIPAADCEHFEDEQGCTAGGCSWTNVAPILDDAEAYACGMAVGTCVWFPEGEGGDDV